MKRHPHVLKICSDQHSPFVSAYAGGFRELFDLARDPDEQVSLADATAYAAARTQREGALDALPRPWRNGPTNPIFPTAQQRSHP